MKKHIQKAIAASFIGAFVLMTGCNSHSMNPCNPCNPCKPSQMQGQQMQKQGQQMQQQGKQMQQGQMNQNGSGSNYSQSCNSPKKR